MGSIIVFFSPSLQSKHIQISYSIITNSKRKLLLKVRQFEIHQIVQIVKRFIIHFIFFFFLGGGLCLFSVVPTVWVFDIWLAQLSASHNNYPWLDNHEELNKHSEFNFNSTVCLVGLTPKHYFIFQYPNWRLFTSTEWSNDEFETFFPIWFSAGYLLVMRICTKL